MKKLLLLFIFFNGFLHSKEMDIENKIHPQNTLTSKDSKQKNNEKMLPKKKIKKQRKFTFAFKPAYFWPQEKKRYRGIYKGGFTPLIETCYITKNGPGVFLEVGYFYKKTHKTSVDINAKTTVLQVPLSLGLIHTFCIASRLDFYLKVGPNWLYTKTYLAIPGMKHTVIKNTFGATFGTGIKIHLFKHFFLELFSNYLYDKKKINDRDSGESFKVYLGGIQAGGGIGYSF